MGMSDKVNLAFMQNGAAKRVQMDNIDMQWTVAMLRSLAADGEDTPADAFELVYCGRKLHDSEILSAVGVKPGVTVHVFKRPVTKTRQPVEEAVILLIISNFRSITKNPSYRNIISNLEANTVLEQVLAAVPDLRQDPVAIALIKEPETLLRLLDLETARKIFQAHPALADAAPIIVSLINKASNAATGSQAPDNWNMDFFSDDDDMDDSGQDDSGQERQRNENPTPGSSMVITRQILGQAISAAFASMNNGSSNTEARPASVQEPDSLTEHREASQQLRQNLAQMHELGLRDDVINMQALQACDMNVQEAINLILSGAMFYDQFV